MTTAKPLRHHSECSRLPEHLEQFRGRHGDELERCTECRRFRVVGPAAKPSTSSTPPPAAGRPQDGASSDRNGPAKPSTASAPRPRYTVACGRCEVNLNVWSGRARVYLCDSCRARRRRRAAAVDDVLDQVAA